MLKDGSFYKGQFWGGLKQGFGTDTLKNVSIYNGSFYGGMKNGFGILTNEDNSIFKGEWKNGEMKGKFLEKKSDIDFYFPVFYK